MLRLLTGLLLTLAAGAAQGQEAAPPPPLEAAIVVDTAGAGPEIDKNIYGHFAEHLGRGIYDGIWVGPNSSIPNIKGYRRDVVDALKKIRVPVIRWPGGCFSEVYDCATVSVLARGARCGPACTGPIRSTGMISARTNISI